MIIKSLVFLVVMESAPGTEQNGALSGRGVVKDKSNFLELYLYQDTR